jgi:hypothetical protein
MGPKIDGNGVLMVAVKEVGDMLLSGASVTVCDILGTLDHLPIPLFLSPHIDDNSLSTTKAEDSTAIQEIRSMEEKESDTLWVFPLCSDGHF